MSFTSNFGTIGRPLASTDARGDVNRKRLAHIVNHRLMCPQVPRTLLKRHFHNVRPPSGEVKVSNADDVVRNANASRTND